MSWPYRIEDSSTFVLPFVFDWGPGPYDEDLEGSFVCMADFPEPEGNGDPAGYTNHYDFASDDQGEGFFFLEEHNELAYEVALREGFAPGQVFYVRVSVECFGGGGYYDNDDYEEVWSYEVLWREKLSPRTTEKLWSEWFMAWAKSRQQGADDAFTWAARKADKSKWYVTIENRWMRSREIVLCTSAKRLDDCHYLHPAPRIDAVDVEGDLWSEFVEVVEAKGWDVYPMLVPTRIVSNLLQHLGAVGWFSEDLATFYLGKDHNYTELVPLKTLKAAVILRDAELRLMALPGEAS